MKTKMLAGNALWCAATADSVLERLRPTGVPLLFEDEGLEMGESTLHTLTCGTLFYGLLVHFARRLNIRPFANLNLYYSAEDPTLYVSPDVMLVRSRRKFPLEMSSYRIGTDGPAPSLVAEVLSFRTYQEGDLTSKPVLYGNLGVAEYVLVDVTGKMLPRKLVLLRRQAGGGWLEEQDKDGGVTSSLGFRLFVDSDGQLRVGDDAGAVYPRPDRAALDLQDLKTAFDKEVELRKHLEAELAELRKGVRNKGRKKL